MTRRFALAVAALVALLAAVLGANAARLRSRQPAVEPVRDAAVNGARLAPHLAGALRFRTVSHADPRENDLSQLDGLHGYLQQTFPKVHQVLARELINGRSALYTWRGARETHAPVVLMAHLDVVPVEPGTEGKWTHPPFAGEVADGFIWGRGALDDKGSAVAILDAVELLLERGHRPRHTLYLAFGHDEEQGGERGAAAIVQRLRVCSIRPEMVLDEGMVVTDGILPVAAPVALVGVAEKGYLSVELRVTTEGGHSSMPPPHTALGILAAAVARLEAHPMPARLRGPTGKMFAYLTPEMPFAKRLVMANQWLFGPLIKRQLASANATNAGIRTTTAATMFSGGVKENVLPSGARAVVNFRILPGDSVTSVLEHVRSTVRDARVQVRPAEGIHNEPSPVSSDESAAFGVLMRTIRQVYPEAIVAPGLVLAATDGRHWAGVARDVYRFVPVRMRSEDLARIHGTDERIAVDDYARSVLFYMQLMRNIQ